MGDRRHPTRQHPRRGGRRVTDRPGQRWYSTGECAALMGCGIKDGFVRGCIEEGLWSPDTGGLVRLEAVRLVTKTPEPGDYSVRDIWLYLFMKAIRWPWVPPELKELASIVSFTPVSSVSPPKSA